MRPSERSRRLARAGRYAFWAETLRGIGLTLGGGAALSTFLGQPRASPPWIIAAAFTALLVLLAGSILAGKVRALETEEEP